MTTYSTTRCSIIRVCAAAAVAIAATASAHAQLTTWTGATNSTWGDAGNWSNGVPIQATGTAVFTSSASQTTINHAVRSDFNSLVFQSGALAYTINGGVGTRGTPGTITVDSGVSNNQIISGNVRNGAGTTATITNNGTGLLDFTGQFLSGSLWTVTFDGPGNITANSILQGGTNGLFSFVKAGSGTLTINTGLGSAPSGATGAGYYAGSTTINGGVLQLGNNLSLGSGTGAITFGGGTLRYGSATVDYSSRIRSSGSAIAINTGTLAAQTFASGLHSSNTGGLTKSGTGILQLNGTNAFTGNIAVNQGSLYINGTGVLGSSGTFAGSITMGNGVNFWYRSDANQTLTGSIESTDVSSIFWVRHQAPLGTGTLTLAAANPNFTSRMIVGAASDTTSATLLVSNSNALQNARFETRSNDKVAFAPGIGTFNVGSLFSGTASGNGNFALNDTAGNAITLSVGGNNRTETAFESVMSGLGGLTKVGSGTLTLAGANTYSGGTDVNAGTLAFDRVSALNSSSGVNVAAGAILDYTGAAGTLSRNVTVSSSGTGTIRNSGGQALTLSGTLTKDGRVLRLTGGTFNVTGQIVGASANSDLLVDGTSTVTLSSANTYNGPTFVNQASTLIVGINDAIPSNSTVTLGDATSTGTLDLGTFANQIGGLVFSGSGGTVKMAANQTASPQLSTSSSLTLGSNASLDLTGMQTSAGNYRLISSTGLSSGTFGSVTGLNSNYVLRYGTVNADEISAQRKAEFGTITATPAAVSIITGGSTAFSYTVANATPTDGSTLSFTSSNGANVIGSSSGTAGANATSASISGLVFTGTGVGLNQTGSFTLTDPNAISTTANGSVSVNVLNHSLASFAATDTATKTLDFGSYDAGSWSGGDGGSGSLAYSVFNIASLGFSDAETAGLNFYDWEFASGDDVFSVGFSSFANLAAGSSNGFFATVVSPGGLAEGSYTGTYTLKFRDQQDLSGAANTRNLSLTMNVVVVPEPGAIALAAIGIAAAAWARRRSR